MYGNLAALSELQKKSSKQTLQGGFYQNQNNSNK